jgi:exopolysaccharide production protein ExoQ
MRSTGSMHRGRATVDDAEILPVRTTPQSPPVAGFHPVVVPLLTLCLVMQMGFARALSFDPASADGTRGGPASQLLILATYAVTLGVLAISPNGFQMLARCWPVSALPVIAALSSLWSVYPVLTLRSAISYAFTTLLGFAIATALPPAVALGVVVRAMAYVCVISAACALLFPEIGVHQASDLIQSVHAGLWRGILVPKVTLGVFAGLALPLIIFYRRVAFRLTLVWLVAVLAAFACLWNAESMTGVLGAVMLTTLLLLFRLAMARMGSSRRSMINIIIGVSLFILVLTISGLLNWLAGFLDKSQDLTGRADIWPAIKSVVTSSPIGTFIGYGYVAGMRSFVGPAILAQIGIEPSDAHNGYLEVVIAFGYMGAMVVLLIHAWIFRGSKRLLLDVPSGSARLAVLPMSLFLTGAFLNYSESLLTVYSSVFTQLTPFVAVWLVGRSTRASARQVHPARLDRSAGSALRRRWN